MSFNFSYYGKYWHVSNAHGHSCRVVSKQLSTAIDKMKTDGHSPYIPDKCNAWSVNANVFMTHLVHIKNIVDKYPNNTFLSDQVWSFVADDSDDDYIFYKHPTKGTFKIHDFASASEIYTIASIKGDPKASSWLELAKNMPDAPI